MPGTDPLESFGTARSDLDPVGRRGERLAHLPREQGRVVVDEQEVGHAALPGILGYGPDYTVARSAFYSLLRWLAKMTRYGGR